MNPKKTQFLLIHHPASHVPASFNVSCKNTTIAAEPNTKYLGVIIVDTLSFNDHINFVCGKEHDKANAFRHGRRNLSRSARRTFYLRHTNYKLQSTLDYASTAYCNGLSSTSYDRLLITSRWAMKKHLALTATRPLRWCSKLLIYIPYSCALKRHSPQTF